MYLIHSWQIGILDNFQEGTKERKQALANGFMLGASCPSDIFLMASSVVN
jgi:hypothetical protein